MLGTQHVPSKSCAYHPHAGPMSQSTHWSNHHVNNTWGQVTIQARVQGSPCRSHTCGLDGRNKGCLSCL